VALHNQHHCSHFFSAIHLENEISRMKNELESLSIHSKLSQQTRHSQSCGILYSVDRMDKDFEVRIIDELYIKHVM